MSPGGKMKSLLSSFTDRIASSTTASNGSTDTVPRKDGFHTAKASDALFTRTTAELDGEDCLHDCESCTVKLPRGFKIDEADKLYGEIKGWSRHLIVATGKTDWVRDVADEKASVMEAVGKHDDAVTGGRLMLSASNIPVPDEDAHEGPYGNDRPTTVLLMPAFQFVDNVAPKHVPELISSVINNAPTNTTPLSDSSSSDTTNGTAADPTSTSDEPPQPALSTTQLTPSALPAGLTLRSCPHKYIILMCSQATRDARCGQTAPLLRKELERHLRPLGLYRDLHDNRPGGVGIYFISHVGGHKYSANIMVYRRGERERGRSVQEQMMRGGGESHGASVGGKGVEDGEAVQCIWLARVRPEDCENLVKYTVLQGKVVKPDRQLRGGFDREKGVVSW